jgi:RHS repeat-associated protein
MQDRPLYGRITNKIDHTTAEMFRYAYNANGWLTNRWVPPGTNTVYAYDAVGNLTSINYSNNTDLTLSYDGNNRLTNMVDALGTTRFTYASFGALLSEDGPWENDTVTYTYDNGRRRNGLSVQAANASRWTQSYTYDNANRLHTISSSAGTFTYGYHAGLLGSSPASLVRQIALPNTSAITNNYDSRGRMLGTWLRKNDGTLLNKHEYALNDLDQRTKQTRTTGDYVDYAYDPLGQLTNAIGKELGGTTNRWQEQFSYRYDAAGNLTNRIQHRLTNSFTINSLNQLSGGSRNGRMSVGGTTTSPATNVTVNTSNSVLYLDYAFASTNHSLADGTNTFTAIGKDNLGRVDTNIVTAYLPASPSYVYDANGNLIYDGIKFFEYDDENQLTWLTATNYWRSQFVYDGKNRRRIRREFTWQNGAWVQTNETRYLYDGNLALQERDNFNVATVSYTRGKDLSGRFEGAGGVAGLLGRTENSTFNQHAYYHCDVLGNITEIINSNQQSVAHYIYDPFGFVISMSGQLANLNLYRFNSKEAHSASGLLYYLYRYYSAANQRWINRDPIEEAGGLNLYGFVGNAPTMSFDAVGYVGELIPCDDADKKAIQKTLNEACDKFNDPKQCEYNCLKNAVGESEANKGLEKIRKFCNNNVKPGKVGVLCDYVNTPNNPTSTPFTPECKRGDVAFGDPKFGTITFCPKYKDGSDPEYGKRRDCTAIHEIAHWGWPDKLDNASAYEKCFSGCPGRKH